MKTIARIWCGIQGTLYPFLAQVLPAKLTDMQRRLVAILEVVRIEEHLDGAGPPRRGRPRASRRALARAFVAKAVYNLPETRLLIEMLGAERNLMHICGWHGADEIPSEATFSRAFAEFAESRLADTVHAALVKAHLGKRLVGHISRDSTEIQAREKPQRKPTPPPQPKRRRGRPRKGEVVVKPAEPTTRIPEQMKQTPQEALAALPTACDVGVKRNSKGRQHIWIGYKAHFDVNDNGLPITVVTTSASLHDSQAAVPMEKLTALRVTSLYSLMDAAYDAELIRQCCRELGHVPLIDSNARSGEKTPFDPAEQQRYKARSTVERAYSRLKDDFGGRYVRVRGHLKVHAHIMFGVLALFADQALKLVSEKED